MRDRSHSQRARAVGVALAGLCLAACGNKRAQPAGPAPELTGLAAVPASVEVVIGLDLGKLADAPVVERVIDQVIARSAPLAERWAHLHTDCKIDLRKQLKRMLVAIGPHAGPQPGTGPVLLVVVGSVPEAELKDCVGKLVGAGGGAVTGKAVAGRTLYQVRDGNRQMYFAYGRPDTVVLGADEAYVTEALGAGKKASDNPELARWLGAVNQNAPVWAAGRTDPRVREGLVRLTEGKLSAGPTGFLLTADFSTGIKADYRATMATPQDAKTLESFARGELARAVAAAQGRSLGAIVGKISIAAEQDVVRLQAALTIDDLNQLLAALDGSGPPAQNSAPPSPGPGSGAK